jgi:hypothetical protein
MSGDWISLEITLRLSLAVSLSLSLPGSPYL